MNQLLTVVDQSRRQALFDRLDRIEPTNDKLSDRYRHVNTIDVVRSLESNGFSISNAIVNKGSSHIVRMRHVDARPVQSQNKNLDGLIPEVVLRSAYDGSSAFTITAGVFRIVCANGLIVGSGLVERVVHIGDAIDKTLVASSRIVNEMPKMIDGIERIGAVQLTDARALQFAKRAEDLILSDNVIRSELTAQHLLRVYRRGDQSQDLWTVFNRVQENALAGRYQVLMPYLTAPGSRASFYGTKARAIKSIDRIFDVNRSLWSLAEEFAA